MGKVRCSVITCLLKNNLIASIRHHKKPVKIFVLLCLCTQWQFTWVSLDDVYVGILQNQTCHRLNSFQSQHFKGDGVTSDLITSLRYITCNELQQSQVNFQKQHSAIQSKSSQMLYFPCKQYDQQCSNFLPKAQVL